MPCYIMPCTVQHPHHHHHLGINITPLILLYLSFFFIGYFKDV